VLLTVIAVGNGEMEPTTEFWQAAVGYTVVRSVAHWYGIAWKPVLFEQTKFEVSKVKVSKSKSQ
jgi:hypothetical protein